MPIQVDFTVVKYVDQALTIPLANPTPIGGWSLQLTAQTRFGGVSGVLVKSMASGFYAASGFPNGVSGMTIVNSGQGVFSVAVNSPDTSGLEYGNYAYAVERLDSGFRSVLLEGYMMVMPNKGGG